MRSKEERIELREFKKSVRKQSRKNKSVLYHVRCQQHKPNIVFYSIEFIFALLLDILKFLLKFIFSVCFIGAIVAIIVCYVVVLPRYKDYQTKSDEIIAQSQDSDFGIKEGSIIYDFNGNVLANLYDTSFCTYLEYDEIPKDVVNAFVSVEDRTFWDNDGVDYKGILRVVYNYVKSDGDEAHGASTITQQLVRSTYLTREVSLDRKFKEIMVSQGITKKYSKAKIIEYYINTCCFGNGVYGIEGASKYYFGKRASELDLAQIAYLCAIPNRPTYYAPKPDDVSNAIPRQQKILGDMLLCGYITQYDYDKAIATDIVVIKPEYECNDYLASYAIDSTVRYLMKLEGYDFKYEFDTMDEYNAYKEQYDTDYAAYKMKLYTGGYRVYTSLDTSVYDNLQSIMNNVLSTYNNDENDDGIYLLQGALTVVDNMTHKVVALVGGRNPVTSGAYTLNRAYQSYRQPGSSIKPLVVYTPALERDWTADTIVTNIDVSVAKKPGVDAQSLSGTRMTLRSAVEQSKNGVAWQIFDKITPKVGLSYITNQEFSNICLSDYNDSSALGGLTYGVTTAEMATAYSTISNNGEYVSSDCLLHVYDKSDADLYRQPKSESVYTKDASDAMIDICKGVLIRGTAANLNWRAKTDMPAFGKTGTTNDNKDIWFCGATPYYSVAVWVGYDTPKTMNGVYGSSYSGTIWKDVMLSLIDGKDVKDFD